MHRGKRRRIAGTSPSSIQIQSKAGDPSRGGASSPRLSPRPSQKVDYQHLALVGKDRAPLMLANLMRFHTLPNF